MKLYTYFRSQASFRVRIALNIKGLAREDEFLHLEKGDQFKPGYTALNPQAVVPTLFDDICLATQVFPATMFKCKLEPYPRAMRIYETCMTLPAFAAAHPMKQPDAE